MGLGPARAPARQAGRSGAGECHTDGVLRTRSLLHAAPALLALVLLAGGCGPAGERSASLSAAQAAALTPTPREAAVRSGTYDWPEFGFDAARSNVEPHATGLTDASVRRLRRITVRLPGTVDSSPIFLHGIATPRGARDLFIVTTTYGKTLALDSASGQRVWEFVPPSAARLTGSAKITNTSPVADPDRRWVYAASPDGRVRKLAVGTGRELRRDGWPAVVTRDAGHEKLAAALNLSGPWVYVVTGGYVGDYPPYQGHVIALDRRTGRRAGIFNSLCSDRRQLLVPSSCPSQLSAIWSRAGAVIEPGSGRIIFTTGNGPWNGRTDWGDSVLELAPGAGRLEQSYTPRDRDQLEATDSDLGSTGPALLPAPGKSARPRYVLQGGKDGVLKLLSLEKLNGRRRVADRTTDGELQRLSGHAAVFTAPAVWRHRGHVFAFVANGSGTAAFELRGRRPRLALVWSNGHGGTSPVLAGGLLYVYGGGDGGLRVYRPGSPHPIVTLPAGAGHWNSPIVAAGRIALPEGNANAGRGSGVLDLYVPR